MKIKIVICGMLAGALIALGVTGCATEKDDQAQLLTQAKISKETALQTAQAKVPNGTLKEGELEKESGKLIWTLDFTIPNSTDIKEVNVDALTGEVVGAVETETAKSGAKAEKD
jgi:uncharacterized membrane protein YkoI